MQKVGTANIPAAVKTDGREVNFHIHAMHLYGMLLSGALRKVTIESKAFTGHPKNAL